MLKIKGIIPAMITPFTEKDRINESAIRKIVNYFIDSGVHGIFCLGTNGEFFSLTIEEKIQVARTVIDETKRRVPIYVGTGGISTRETVMLSEKMEELGADALSVITPYFIPITQNELISHYKSVASSVSIPITLYNIPARTGVSIEPKTVQALSKINNVVGVKDSSGSFDMILKYLENVDSDFNVLSGSDSLILYTLIAGGSGAVAATANVFAGVAVSIYESFISGDLEKAMIAQNLLRPLRHLCQQATLPSVLKEAMNIMGLEAGSARSPIDPASEDLKAALRILLNQHFNSIMNQGEPLRKYK